MSKKIIVKEACLAYIEDYWDKITCVQKKDAGIRIGMPNKYVCPNDGIFLKDQFYWDSYFIILGLLTTGRTALAKGMVENLADLFSRFHIVPMRNRFYNTGTSQIPFLTSAILEVHAVLQDRKWLRQMSEIAQDELNDYWLNDKLTEKHVVRNGMVRFCDHFLTHTGAEHESGWDMTSRFGGKCLDILPVDLNSCIYKYEHDLSAFHGLLGNKRKSELYRRRARMTRERINRTLWNESSAFYFDYNFVKGTQNKFWSVAGFYPLWAGIASKKTAKTIVERTLPKFIYRGGIVNTRNKYLDKEFHQHDFPNGWPHQQYIVLKGLLNYGYKKEAEQIAMKWILLNEQVFETTGKFWEKYNVVDGAVGLSCAGRYPTQPGFAWTNAIYLWIHKNILHPPLKKAERAKSSLP